MDKHQELKNQIEDRKTNFKTESYSMSIGELVNMYKNNEIIIRPEYQRLFRWSELQKIKLIESILIGIPLPTIFVYQDEEGRWELVDGLQRVSTILQFMGELRENGSEDEKVPALVLKPTKYLPAFENYSWENVDDDKSFPESLKLAVKRSKLNINIILNDSDHKAKFEIFQRLNTGGSMASGQEIRNNIMIMLNKERYDWFDELSNNIDFLNSISISDRLLDEQYHKDLLLRFIALYSFEYNGSDIRDFLDAVNEELLETGSEIDFAELKAVFEKTFKLINTSCEDQAFKKRGKGKFLESGFEAITIGIAKNIARFNLSDEGTTELIKNKVDELYDQDFYVTNAGSGTNAKTRINNLVPEAIQYFSR